MVQFVLIMCVIHAIKACRGNRGRAPVILNIGTI